jgi:hypothetical protein
MFHVVHDAPHTPEVKRCSHTGVCPESREHFTKRAKAEAYLLDELAKQVQGQQRDVMLRELRAQEADIAERVSASPALLPTDGFRGLAWAISGLRSQQGRNRELLAGSADTSAVIAEAARLEINNGRLEDTIKAKWRAWLEHEYATEDLTETQRDIIFHRALRTDAATGDQEKRYKKEAKAARELLFTCTSN